MDAVYFPGDDRDVYESKPTFIFNYEFNDFKKKREKRNVITTGYNTKNNLFQKFVSL